MYLKALAISAPLCCHQQYASSTHLSEWLLKHWWVASGWAGSNGNFIALGQDVLSWKKIV